MRARESELAAFFSDDPLEPDLRCVVTNSPANGS